MPLPRELEETQSDVDNAPVAAVDPLTNASFSLGGKEMSTVNEVATRIVSAAATAKQIQDLELIRLPPNFPASGLQATIHKSQMNISDYADDFRGPIRQQMTTVVFDILQFSDEFIQLSEECFEKLKCTEETLQSEKAILLACFGDMMEMVEKILNGLNVHREIDRIIAGLTHERDTLNDCIRTYDKEQQNYEQKLEDEKIEREWTQKRIEEVRSERRRTILKVVAAVGLALLIGVGIIVAATVPGAALIGVGATVVGVGCVGMGVFASVPISLVTAVGVCTAAEVPDRIQHAHELSRESQRLQSKLEGTLKERMLNISNELQYLLQLSYSFKKQLSSVRDDWRQLSTDIERTIERLQSAKTNADINVMQLVKIKLGQAKMNWLHANNLAKALHEGWKIHTSEVGIRDISSIISDLASSIHPTSFHSISMVR